jgi:hypothetical protein
MAYVVAGSFFFATVDVTTHQFLTRARLIEMGILLLAVSGDLMAGKLSRRQFAHILAVFLFFSTVAAVWLLFIGTPPGLGSGSAYVAQAGVYVAYLTALVAYCVRYYRGEYFVRAFYNLGRIEISIALVSLVLSRATHQILLVTPSRGIRLQGTLSEPSAWAAVIAPMLILAWRRRAWLIVILTIAAGVGSESPTVIVGTGAALLIYWFLVGDRRIRKWYGVLLLTVALPLGVSWTQHANYEQMRASRNGMTVALGRAIAATHTIGENLQQGPTAANENERLSTAAAVIDEVRGTSKFWTGWGLGASDKYFPAKYGVIADHTLWLTVLFDFGVVAAGLLVIVGIRAMCKMRARPCAAIFIPLIVYAFINSAGGWGSYQLPVIGIILFGFSQKNSASERSTASEVYPTLLQSIERSPVRV